MPSLAKIWSAKIWSAKIWSGLVGLFVDDGRFAGSILAWIVVCALVLPRLGLSSALPPAALFTGLAVILVRSAIGRSRRG